MGSGPSHIEPVTADEVLTVQFTHIRKGGYDTQEVDAFLDRVAATMESEEPLLPDGSMTADDVRNVEFSHMKRGGYDTREVDTFLDRVVAVLGSSHPPALAMEPVDPMPMDEPEPRPAAEAAPASADNSPAVAPVASAAGGPQLHDPEGAAQRLLAAAQLAADTLTADAESYAARVRREADDYAAATTGEADAHAERVTAAAEAQAATIREVAADEARRVAEQARAELVQEIDALEARRTELEQQTSSLQGRLATDRTRILTFIEELRATVVATGTDTAAPGVAASAPAMADVADEVEEAFAGLDDVDQEIVEADVDQEVVEADVEPLADLEVDEALTVDEDEIDDADLADIGGDADDADDQDLTAAASRSVFDLGDEADADLQSDADWLDDPDHGTGAVQRPGADQTSAELFDIEADPDWADEGGPPTRATSAITGADAGDRFFEDLRHADPDDSLGPLDDDTDAALSAFFDADDETDSGGRWSDRFGPGR